MTSRSRSNGVTRPVWEPGEATQALYETARGIAGSMGIEFGHGSAGRRSHGNFTGAMGIASLDGRGAQGNDYHTLQERSEVAGLSRRGRLMAGLLAWQVPSR
jgi:glutamate carboxypeptidase